MSHTNRDLLKIMQDHKLNCADVAHNLGVPLKTVEGWIAIPSSKGFLLMPEIDLRILQFGLMTENTRRHLF